MAMRGIMLLTDERYLEALKQKETREYGGHDGFVPGLASKKGESHEDEIRYS